MRDPDDEQAMIDEAVAHLRGHTQADLRFDEHFRPIRYVVGPDGRLVAPVMAAMLESIDTVLYIPECVEDAMEVQVTIDPFKEREHGAVTDQWRIYHGEPEDIYWAWLDIDAARLRGCVLDGEALVRANPLAAEAARICKHMNSEHIEDLHNLALHFAHMKIENPRMVGIDPDGIDVRARFDVVRVPVTKPITSANDAREVLKAMSIEAREAIRGIDE